MGAPIAAAREASEPFVALAFATPTTKVEKLIARLCAKAGRNGVSSEAALQLAHELRAAALRLRTRTVLSAGAAGGRQRAAAWVLSEEYQVGLFMRTRRWSPFARARVQWQQWTGPTRGRW